MQVEGEVTLRDVKAFARALFARRVRKRGKWYPLMGSPWLMLLVCMLIASACTALRLLLPDGGDATSFLGMLMNVVLVVFWITIALAGVTFFMLFVLVPRMVSKQPGVLGHRVISIEADGFRERTATIDQQVKWEGIREIDATDEHFFVFIGPDTAHVIPRRFFRSADDAERFVAELRQRLRALPAPPSAPVFVPPD